MQRARALPAFRSLGLLLLVALGVVLASAPACAQSITATIDRTEATLQDQLRLTLSVENGGSARPQLPGLEDFHVLGQGQESEFIMGTGGRRDIVRYNLILSPRRTGTLTIPAATLEVGGKTYRSDPITVRILEASQQPSQEDDEIYVRATVSDTEPFVGEQILFTWRLYRRVQMAQAQLGNFELDGFTVEELAEVEPYETVINGQRYIVHEIRRALFPQESGTLTIPAVELRCAVVLPRGRRGSAFDSFFGRGRTETRRLVTRPISVEVRPLPPAPAGFSGLVGDFNLTARLSKQQLKVGESATLQMTVSGRGNVQQIPEPRLPDLPQMKLYPDSPESRFNRDGRTFTGSRTFTTSLVPVREGEQTLPSIDLVYFDPDSERFRTSSTPEMRLEVAPGDGQEDLGLTVALTPGGGKGAVRILSDDILPIHRRLDAIDGPTLGSGPLWLLGLVLPPILYFGLRRNLGQRRLYRQDHRLLRCREALKTALQGIAELRKEGGDPRQATEHASRILRGYIGDKLGVEGTALTPEEAAQLLRRQGLEDESITPVRRMLESLEAAQYSATGAVARPDELPSQLEERIRDLEGRLGKKSPSPPPSRRGRRGASLGGWLLLGLLLSAAHGLLAQPPDPAAEPAADPAAEPSITQPQDAPAPEGKKGEDGELEDLGDAGSMTLNFPNRQAPAGTGESGENGAAGPGISSSDRPDHPAGGNPAGSHPASETPAASRPALDLAETFFTANTAYEAGDYPRAADLYRSLLAEGHDAADLHFNLGNTYLRLGQLGQAIASYRRAEAHAPRDQDVAANLAFARGNTTDALEPPRPPALLSTLFFWHYGLSRAELATAALVLNLLFWSLLALRLLRPGSELLRWALVAVLILLIAIGASLALRILHPTRIAVITPLEVEARSGPGADDKLRFKLHTGAEVRLLERRPGWLRIALPNSTTGEAGGEQGWIAEDQAEVVRW